MAHGAVCDTHGLIQGSDSAKPFVPFSGSPACVSEAASPWDGNQLAGTPNAILPTAQVLLRSPSPCCHGCDARNARDRGCLCRCRMPSFDKDGEVLPDYSWVPVGASWKTRVIVRFPKN